MPISPYLKTLRRVPDDIILSVASRDMDLSNTDTCVCGWVLREALARCAGEEKDAEACNVHGGSYYVTEELRERFGGAFYEWNAIYWGVVDIRLPDIELAFVKRVNEAVARS